MIGDGQVAPFGWAGELDDPRNIAYYNSSPELARRYNDLLPILQNRFHPTKRPFIMQNNNEMEID